MKAIKITWVMLFVLLSPLFFAGCASIISGTTQEMTFQSSPSGTTVTVSGKVLGQTPITIRLDKKTDQSATFAKEGYKPVTLPLTTSLDGWFWGNIVIGGFIGSTTDGVSGAVHEYSPSQFFVTLEKESDSQISSPASKTPREKATEFIIIGYQNLRADLQKGKGQYIDSLFKLLNIPVEQQGEALRKIRALSEVYTGIPDFAEHVVDLYVP